MQNSKKLCKILEFITECVQEVCCFVIAFNNPTHHYYVTSVFIFYSFNIFVSYVMKYFPLYDQYANIANGLNGLSKIYSWYNG